MRLHSYKAWKPSRRNQEGIKKKSRTEQVFIDEEAPQTGKRESLVLDLKTRVRAFPAPWLPRIMRLLAKYRFN
jgi:hypothetical protein